MKYILWMSVIMCANFYPIHASIGYIKAKPKKNSKSIILSCYEDVSHLNMDNIENNSTLTRISFHRVALNSFGRFMRALKTCKNFTDFTITDTSISSPSINLIVKFLSDHESLQKFCLQKCTYFDGIQDIVKACNTIPTLTELSLGFGEKLNQTAKQDFLEKIADLLVSSTCALIHLNLSGNYLDDSDCKFLGYALAKNKTLEELSLVENNISTTGAEFLIRSIAKRGPLPGKTKLFELNLRDNEIDGEKLQKFNDSLNNQVYLANLNLLRNDDKLKLHKYLEL